MKRSRLGGVIATLAISVFLLVPTPTKAFEFLDFELDGNIRPELENARDDWTTVFGGTGNDFENTGVIADGLGKSIFTRGGSKDVNPVSRWHHKDGSTPDKNELVNGYAAAYDDNGDLVIVFGADRYSDEGDANIGAWFRQSEVLPQSDGTFSGESTDGDVLVVVGFSKGGDVPSVSVYAWQSGQLVLLSNDDAARCDQTMSQEICAITNTVDLNTSWAYQSKQNPSGILPAHHFVEGAVNVSAIFEAANLDLPCFSSFLIETRSSTEENAQLKDFVAGGFNTCELEITKACPSGTFVGDAGPAPFFNEYNGTVTNAGFGTVYDVTVVDDQGTPNDTSDDVEFQLGNGADFTLARGESDDFTGSFYSTLNPATNGAVVKAKTDPDGEFNVFASLAERVECPEIPLSATIDVTKQCSTALEVVNGKVVVRVDFTGTVKVLDSGTNPVTVDSIVVTDDGGTPNDTSDDQLFNIGTLAPGQSDTFSGSYYPSSSSTDPSTASFSDSVTASGVGRFGTGEVSDMTSATCPLCIPAQE